jgi:uncharacterized protein YecT (DUF1311 family)
MRHRSVVLVLGGILVAGRVQAQRPDFTKCGELLQQPMNQCYAQEAVATTATLDTLIATLWTPMDGAERTALGRIQVRWLAYVTSHCSWEGAKYAGGSLEPTIRATCRISHTWDRIDELRRSLCEGGSSDCAESRRFQPPPRWQHAPEAAP